MAGPTCRSCGAPIKWGRTPKNRAVPLDPLPTDAGTYRFDAGGYAVYVAPADPYTGPRYMPHHATCRQGRAWKRSGSRPRRTIERRNG